MTGQRWKRRIAVLAVPVLFTLALFVGFGSVGYNPSDDGNVLAQSARILHGQVPHRDVIFARPMGSALLHTIDFAIPLPLFEASRLVGIAEIVIYTMLFGWLIYGRSPSAWRPVHHAGVLGATLINLHTFPLMGWYTTDGLLFVAAGAVLVESGIRRRSSALQVLGLLCLGAAPLMKQSFALAPLLGLACVLVATRAGDRVRWLRLVVLLGAAAAPLVFYICAMAMFGALGDFIDQIATAQPVWGRPFVDVFVTDANSKTLVWASALVAGFVALDATADDRKSAPSSNGVSHFLFRIGLSGFLILMPLTQGLRFGNAWPFGATWALLALVVVRVVMKRGFDFVAFGVVAIAWMTAVSWGYASPNLMGGTVLLTLLHRVWRGGTIVRPSLRAVAAACVIASLVLASVIATRARNRYPYYDRGRGELTASIRDVSSAFGRILTNPVTAGYLRNLKECVDRYPASDVAVLPDNPGIYPALGLKNPFPIDWMYSNEIEEEGERIERAAREIDRRGDYLILFQTFSVFSLPRLSALPVATEASPIFFHGVPIGGKIFDALHGRTIVCGAFIGKHGPS